MGDEERRRKRESEEEEEEEEGGTEAKSAGLLTAFIYALYRMARLCFPVPTRNIVPSFYFHLCQTQ